MKIRTAQSRTDDSARAVKELVESLQIGSCGPPDFLTLHFAASRPAEQLRLALAGQAATLHGGTSCCGIMTEAGPIFAPDAGMAALAIWDAGGSYGTASADLGPDATATARRVTEAALEAAGRRGEIPDLVWLTIAPGREEQALEGVRAVVGDEAIIVGGSASDDDLGGSWSQFGPQRSHVDGLVVSVMFPSVPVASSLQGSYAPTGDAGNVTQAQGRRLMQIDNRPAAQVYREWTGGAVPAPGQEGPLAVLPAATLWPLGRVVRQVAGVPYHVLALPTTAHPDGTLDLLADLGTGDRIWQMNGSVEGLVMRAERTARQARDDAGGEVAGALIVCCCGCMVAFRDRMSQVHAGICEALGDAPWLSLFSFGVQGMIPGEGVRHGNLQVMCATFSS